MKRYDPTPPWVSYEVVLRASDGRLDPERRPFSAALSKGGDQITTALTKMWLVGYHGWPHAILALVDDRRKPLIQRADDAEPEIWILKAKPTCWRLYFYVYKEKQRLAYLHACCKKKNARDQTDCDIARTLFRSIGGARGHGLIEFHFTSG